MATRFAWDQKKSRANLRKHRLSFETALLVFDDPNAISHRERDVDGEQRWQTIGWAQTAILVVAHTTGEEDGDEVIRIISARKATRSERVLYEEETD